jgi:F0F1-type ATP synthase assembly protein I
MRGEMVAAAMRLLGMGWYVVTALVLGVWGGSWLDGRLGTSPWLTLGGLALGTSASLWGLYRMVQPLLRGSRSKFS